MISVDPAPNWGKRLLHPAQGLHPRKWSQNRQNGRPGQNGEAGKAHPEAREG